MIENLFGSKTRVKLLHVFLTNPNRSFYVREITRKIDEQINSVRRELSNLLSIGIIKSDTSGNRLYYEVNQKHPDYEALRSIFMNLNSNKESTISQTSDAIGRFKSLGSVDYAALSGVFTRDNVAPVDILIVGDINRNKLDKLVAELEKEEGRELRYTVLSREQYDYRRNLNDRFLSSVLDSKLSVLIDRVTSVKQSSSVDESENSTKKSVSSKKSKKKKSDKK